MYWVQNKYFNYKWWSTIGKKISQSSSFKWGKRILKVKSVNHPNYLAHSLDCTLYHFFLITLWILPDCSALNLVDNVAHLQKQKRIKSTLKLRFPLPGSHSVPLIRARRFKSDPLWPCSRVFQFHQMPHFAHSIMLHKPFSFKVKWRHVGHSRICPDWIICWKPMKSGDRRNLWEF